jgi:septum formation protein
MTERSPLVLASASPFRRRLLEAAGLLLEVLPAEVDEPRIKAAARARGAAPWAIADLLARAKAEAVSARCLDRIVVGADQVLALEGEIFDKPADLAAAREHLVQLRGRQHSLYTAVSLAVGGNSAWSTVQEARLRMRPFSDAFLSAYLASAGDGLLGSVGGYQIEGLGVQLFERIEGCHFAIVGLPLVPLLAELRRRGVIAQ